MLSETLLDGLGQYEIGAKLRALRLRKKMGLVELGRHSGLSAALLSKLERGLLFPTLPTLMRIALVFGVGLDHFFSRQPQPVLEIVRRAERRRFPDRPGGRDISYEFESLDYKAVDRPFNGYLAEFEAVPAERVRSHAHAGVELLYLVAGSLNVRVGERDHVLHAGDAMYFDSSVPHAYWRLGSRRCTAVVITTAWPDADVRQDDGRPERGGSREPDGRR